MVLYMLGVYCDIPGLELGVDAPFSPRNFYLCTCEKNIILGLVSVSIWKMSIWPSCFSKKAKVSSSQTSKSVQCLSECRSLHVYVSGSTSDVAAGIL